jgi:predicted Ser/Thr protein kinase
VKGKINELEANNNSKTIRNLDTTYMRECKKVTNWLGKCKMSYIFLHYWIKLPFLCVYGRSLNIPGICSVSF